MLVPTAQVFSLNGMLLGFELLVKQNKPFEDITLGFWKIVMGTAFLYFKD